MGAASQYHCLSSNEEEKVGHLLYVLFSSTRELIELYIALFGKISLTFLYFWNWVNCVHGTVKNT